MNVAIFVFDEIQILDFTGPMDVFATREDLFTPFTVGQTKEAITTFGGLSINPSYDFGNAPAVDILIIPGGTVNAELDKPEVIDWIRDTAAQAKHVLSICTGSFLVAKAGLLKGLTTTTYHSRLERMRRFGQDFTVVDDQRFVDNGKVICAAGISSGIDASFHLITKILDLGEAQQIALDLEFDWSPTSQYARGALADLHLPSLNFPTDAEVLLKKTEGDRKQWTRKATVRLAEPLVHAADFFGHQLREAGLGNVALNREDLTLTFRWQETVSEVERAGHLSVIFEDATTCHYELHQRDV